MINFNSREKEREGEREEERGREREGERWREREGGREREGERGRERERERERERGFIGMLHSTFFLLEKKENVKVINADGF